MLSYLGTLMRIIKRITMLYRDSICISQIYLKIITQPFQVAGVTECMIRPYRIHWVIHMQMSRNQFAFGLWDVSHHKFAKFAKIRCNISPSQVLYAFFVFVNAKEIFWLGVTIPKIRPLVTIFKPNATGPNILQFSTARGKLIICPFVQYVCTSYFLPSLASIRPRRRI